MLEASWNVMAHAQKPDFVFRRNGLVHLNLRGASVQSTTGSRGVRISGSNAGYTMFRGSVKGTGYPLHSPVSPFTSPPVRHRVPSHFNRSLTTQGGFVGFFFSGKKMCLKRRKCGTVRAVYFEWKILYASIINFFIFCNIYLVSAIPNLSLIPD